MEVCGRDGRGVLGNGVGVGVCGDGGDVYGIGGGV